MNKAELEIELIKVNKQLTEEKKSNTFLFNSQKKYIKLAEEVGSELAAYTAMVVRLDEELTKLKSVVKRFKGENK